MAGEAEAALGSLTWDRGVAGDHPARAAGVPVARAAAQVADGSEANCTSPLRWGGCWSWSGWPATRRSAVGPRPPRCCRPTRAAAGRASGSAAGRRSAPGWSCRTPARAAAVVRLGAGDGRREPGAFVSVAAALELAVAGGKLRPRRQELARGPAGGHPPAPGGCRAGAGWAELAGGGGGGRAAQCAGAQPWRTCTYGLPPSIRMPASSRVRPPTTWSRRCCGHWRPSCEAAAWPPRRGRHGPGGPLAGPTAERLGSDRWMPIVTLAGPPWPPDGATSPSRCSPPPTAPGLQQDCLAGRYLEPTGQPPPRRHLRAVQ